MHKQDIKNFTLGELEKALVGIGEPSYRAKQLFDWLYRAGVRDFSDMPNIPSALKDKLDKNYYIGKLTPQEHLKSSDGTEKILFKLSDNRLIETVLIPAKQRKTVCLSTQVGCKFACVFCASGSKGFTRDLTTSEITSQISYLKHDLKHEITNYVFMGMGEPLDNYKNLESSIIIMNDPKGMNIPAGSITVSTSGIIPGIEKLKNMKPAVNLSISIHAASNELRDKLVPINKRYPLGKLLRSCEGFTEKTGKTITLEYVLIKDVNDSPKAASGLAVIAKRLKAKVNIIPYSLTHHKALHAPSKKDVTTFMKHLKASSINVTLRESKGGDIRAACGQLAGEVLAHGFAKGGSCGKLGGKGRKL